MHSVLENDLVTIYGISNCDTVKKARAWLGENAIAYRFHDLNKAGIDEDRLRSWVEELGWEALLNRRGMMWRNLPQGIKEGIDEQAAVKVMLETPSIIKRPLLDTGTAKYVGFNPQQYAQIFFNP